MAANILDNLANWSTTDASNQPDAADTTDLPGEFRRIQAVVRKYLATSTTLAAGATTDLSTATGNVITLTGAIVTITSLGTVAAGLQYSIIANAAHVLTHNATSLILPTGANITMAAGDVATFVSEGSGNWRCINYMDATGYQPLDATLTALAGVLSAANKIPYATALNTAGELDFKDEDNMASDSATALPSQQSVKAYADAIKNGGTLISGTAQASTSGTSIDFTSIPSWAKKITIMLNGVSTSGTSAPIIQIGDSGGVETTGYSGSGANTVNSSPVSAANYTTGFGIHSLAAANVLHGAMVIELMDSSVNSWVASGVFAFSNTAGTANTAGTKALSAALDRVRITTVNGTDTFDAGSINILYE